MQRIREFHMRTGRNLFAFLCLFGISRSSSVSQTYRGVDIESRPTGLGYALCGSCSVPESVSAKVWLTGSDEPGEPIVISGRFYREDGVTPDSGITMFVYQADAGGYYHRPVENVFHPRILGWVRTGRDGYYEIHTVRPGSEIMEANGPGHIHAHVFGGAIPEHFIHEFWFQGDRFIPPGDQKRLSQLGKFSPIITLTRGTDGISRGTRDIWMRPAAAWKYQRD
jgi:protocatechuate 3,4-dioxygenase beta subunit